MSQIGPNLKAERARRDMTRDDAAVHVGLTEGVIRSIEIRNNCDLAQAELIARAFDIHPAVLVGWVSPENAGLLNGDGSRGRPGGIESRSIHDESTSSSDASEHRRSA